LERLFPEKERVYEDFDLWIRIGARYPVAHSKKVCVVYNRATPDNARTTHKAKVIYSATFFQTLERLSNEPTRTQEQKEWIRQIKDRRIVVYVFSLLCTRQREKAREVLKGWDVSAPYKKYKMGLLCATLSPYFLIDWVQAIRLKVF
jgi:hypothetical protein